MENTLHMNPKTSPTNAHVNTPSQMITPIQPITDDLPKNAATGISSDEQMGGLNQEEAASVTATAKVDEVPPAEKMSPQLYRDDEV